MSETNTPNFPDQTYNGEIVAHVQSVTPAGINWLVTYDTGYSVVLPTPMAA